MRALLVAALALLGHARTGAGAGAGAAPSYPVRMARLMDTSIDPCDDFYGFACGTWLNETELPAGTAMLSQFTMAEERSRQVLRDAIDGTGQPQVGALYASCMDVATLDALGVLPVQRDLDRIQSATTMTAVMRVAGHLTAHGLPSLLTLTVRADKETATENMLRLGDPHVTMPVTSYYVDDAKWETFGAALHKYAQRLLLLAGLSPDDAMKGAHVACTIERRVATIVASLPADDQNETMTLDELMTTYPLLVGAMLTGAKVRDGATVDSTTRVVVAQSLRYLEQAEELVASLEVADMQRYLIFRWLSSQAEWLSGHFQAARFEIDQILVGYTSPRPRWSTCITLVTEALPNLAGRYFVQAMANPEAEATVVSIVTQLEQSMKENIASRPWLDDKTRKNALTKLSKLTKLIGHDDNINASDNALSKVDCNLRADSLVANIRCIRHVQFRNDLEKVGQPVDKDEWILTALDANAKYRMLQNELVLPMGMFQPPFFHPSFSMAENFGGIGTIVGHELTHAFDSHGRLFDAYGRMKPWWTGGAAKQFKARTLCLQTQYSSFVVKGEDGDVIGAVDGKRTITEDIADNGGLSVAYRALREQRQKLEEHLHVEEHGHNRHHHHYHHHHRGHHTDDKVFFVAFAQNFCTKATDNILRTQLSSNAHAPSRWRVNGAVMNSAAFAHVFQCPASSAMIIQDKCEIW
ncbi:TPA: hypothetical protein N0F65_011149 [Lagenidium giganteum]|uniref:Endothelin-converting enzyme 1 n=1 Tax=Lagenidium giganteum TaxID=4803 RepID=A0AAV2Z9H6_9STRA|nr:TPA: hypothetical protein N0F65_011149 [Lagenidium giganteum]